MRLGSYDGASYAECNGPTVVTVSQILMDLGQFFIHQQTLRGLIVHDFFPVEVRYVTRRLIEIGTSTRKLHRPIPSTQV